MGTSLVLGNKLVHPDELVEKHSLGMLDKVQTDPSAMVKVSSGTVSAASLKAAPQLPTGSAPAYEPVGIGKPLGIEILTVYTGDAPVGGLFGNKKKDLLVVSGVKGPETFAAAPRAINQMRDDIGPKTYLQGSAFAEGSTIVYYTPSLINASLFTSVELVFDQFNEAIFEEVAGMFKQAAGLPVFAPASAYLLAGSFITKIAESLGKALLEKGPYLSADIDLRFDTPGLPVAMASHLVFYNDRDQQELSQYETKVIQSGGSPMMALVDPQSGDRYEGDAPYIIANLDGRNRDNELHNFKPHIAQAAILDQFYGSKNAGGDVVKALQSAMSLYNDLNYRTKAEALKTTIDGLDPSSADYQKQFEKAKTLYDAYNANIQLTDVFKLPAIEPKSS